MVLPPSFVIHACTQERELKATRLRLKLASQRAERAQKKQTRLRVQSAVARRVATVSDAKRTADVDAQRIADSLADPRPDDEAVGLATELLVAREKAGRYQSAMDAEFDAWAVDADEHAMHTDAHEASADVAGAAAVLGDLAALASASDTSTAGRESVARAMQEARVELQDTIHDEVDAQAAHALAVAARANAAAQQHADEDVVAATEAVAAVQTTLDEQRGRAETEAGVKQAALEKQLAMSKLRLKLAGQRATRASSAHHRLRRQTAAAQRAATALQLQAHLRADGAAHAPSGAADEVVRTAKIDCVAQTARKAVEDLAGAVDVVELHAFVDATERDVADTTATVQQVLMCSSDVEDSASTVTAAQASLKEAVDANLDAKEETAMVTALLVTQAEVHAGAVRCQVKEAEADHLNEYLQVVATQQDSAGDVDVPGMINKLESVAAELSIAATAQHCAKFEQDVTMQGGMFLGIAFVQMPCRYMQPFDIHFLHKTTRLLLWMYGLTYSDVWGGVVPCSLLDLTKSPCNGDATVVNVPVYTGAKSQKRILLQACPVKIHPYCGGRNFCEPDGASVGRQGQAACGA